MRKILILTVLFLANILIFAQVNSKKCITTSLVKGEILDNNDYAKARDNSTVLNLNDIEKSTITIPVVIHIIHRTSHTNIGSGTNIPDIQIEDALRILNEDYSKTNPEFPSPPRNTFLNYWGNPDLEFCLATINPNGNSTTGITRTATAQVNWDADDDGNGGEANAMKKTSSGGINSWDPKKYLNIWVCDLTNSQGGGQTLGYAYLPGLLAGFAQNAWKDGLVVDYRYFGTVGIAAPSSDGRTATHEIGHYLGLEHTFCEQTDTQGNPICCDNDNTNWGGYVNDTPAAKDIYFGSVTASTNNNTCNDLSYSNVFNTNVKDMDENFMSYAANTWMFSQGQIDVMLNTLNTSEMNGGRSALKNSTVSVNCSGTVDINEYKLSNLHIYPNPTLGKLDVTSDDKINTISISNIIGETVFFVDNFTTNSINLSSLKVGVYFINISTDKGTHIEKIILSK